MITTLTKQSRTSKKREWDIYHNIGVQYDAERFSLIDSVLDDELNNSLKTKKKVATPAKVNLLVRILKGLKTKLSHHIYRTYLFCWFSMYFAVNAIGSLVSRN